MATSVTCGSCIFFDAHTKKVTKSDGLCRFNPPVSQPDEAAHGLWPVVTKKDWCGHFTADRTA